MKALFLSLCLFSSLAHAAVMEPKSGAVSFRASANPGALAIRGTGHAPTGKLALDDRGDKIEVNGTLSLDVSSFETGIALRDRHMKEKYLETGKFPDAQLVLAKQLLPKQGAGPFDGELFLHGVKHAVHGEAEVGGGGGGPRTVKAKFPVNLSDHSITVPSFAGISLANEVSVETEMQLSPN